MNESLPQPLQGTIDRNRVIINGKLFHVIEKTIQPDEWGDLVETWVISSFGIDNEILDNFAKTVCQAIES